MRRDIIPNHIMQFFQKNPYIGRYELAKAANIPETEARFYCRVYKEMTSKIKYKSKGIALFDIHYPMHDRACMNVVSEFINDFKPDSLVYGGDQLHMDSISAWNAKKPKLTENKRLSREYKGFQSDILERIENLNPKCEKFFIVGNHEYRIQHLIEKCPQYEGFIELERNLNLEDYTIIPFNDVFNIGDMHFAHGWYYNKYYAVKTIRVAQRMIFVGHVHIPQLYTTKSPAYTLPKQCVGVGCLCNTNPYYLREAPNAWVHQFLYWYMFDDGTFSYYTPIIINGRCIINGKVYDGNK